MPKSRHTPEQKSAAIELLAAHGAAEAARRTGISAGTIGSWASRAGVTSATSTIATAVAVEARLVTISERKAALAEQLAATAQRMLDEVFGPTIERKVVPGTQFRPTEIVDVRHKTTTPAERRTTIEAVARALETVQLLTGEATQRVEQMTKRQAIEEARERAGHLRAV